MLLVLALARTAQADPQNGQLLPLGERQAYLGNTGVGDATDTGAVYFNPSGLGFVDRGKVNVTGSVYMSYSTHGDATFRLDDTDLAYGAKGFVTIPMTFVVAQKFGELRLAFSTLVPETLVAENQQSFVTPNTTGQILQYYRESELWVGLSAAYPISPQLSVGVSVYGIQHSESSLVSLVVDFPADTTSFVTGSSREQLSTLALSAIFGVTYRPIQPLSLGLRLQTPVIQLSGSADTYQATRAPGQAPETEAIENAKAKYQLPFDLTLGAALQIAANWQALLDVGLRLGLTYDTIAGSSQNEHIATRPTPRISVGQEWKPIPTLPLRAGFFFSPSAVRDGPGALREHYYGVTGGAAYITEHVETGVGVFYIWSTGTQRADDGRPSNVSTSAIGALLTTAYVF